MPKVRRRPAKRRSAYTASTADRHRLYELSVQEVESEIDFVDAEFRKIRRRRARTLREDFCGTANSSCEWVRRRSTNFAVGLDLDADTLAWGQEHHVDTLRPAQRRRISLLRRNVLTPGPEGSGVDCVLAMNFSYFIFKTRAEMLRYFRTVRDSLVKDGVLFMDYVGGWECMRAHREIRKERGFRYVWRQKSYDPISGEISCSISFAFPDGTRLRDAFTYDWRLWTLRELREVLADAGFKKTTVYWEGDDGNGGGDGVFTPAEHGDACASFIGYLVAEK